MLTGDANAKSGRDGTGDNFAGDKAVLRGGYEFSGDEMMRLTYEKILDILLIVCCISLIILFVVGAIKLEAEHQCLKHGWKSAKVTWRLERYCIREENEYEIVRPLREIIGESD